MQTLRTQLRRFDASDLSNMIALGSDPEVVKFTPARVPWTLENTKERLQALIDNQPAREPLGVWAAEELGSKKFIGWFMILDTGKEFPELGFMIVRSQWGQGYTFEIAQRLVEYAFEEVKLKGLVATTDQDHSVSKRILAKLGFKFVKTFSDFDKVRKCDIALDHFEMRR